MKETEVAEALGISERTVRKDWRWARTVLSERMAETAG
jgi:DNA-binding CsgD family transcriptional regulator